MTTSRPDFDRDTARIIGERAGYRCAMPNCRRLTRTADPVVPSRSERTGKAAHICGARPTARRYDASMSDAARASVENGIWLCGHCHDSVDLGSEAAYPVAMLTTWKRLSEIASRRDGDTLDRTTRLLSDLDDSIDEATRFREAADLAMRWNWSSKATGDAWERERLEELKIHHEVRSEYVRSLHLDLVGLRETLRAYLGPDDPDLAVLAEALAMQTAGPFWLQLAAVVNSLAAMREKLRMR